IRFKIPIRQEVRDCLTRAHFRPNSRVKCMTFLPRIRTHFKANIAEEAGEIAFGPALLHALVLFVISVASVKFARNAHSIVTLWPSNAILLAFLLRSARDARNYGLIFLGGATAIALANLAGGNSPASVRC